ncbi:SufE-like protein [Drosera capensis]
MTSTTTTTLPLLPLFTKPSNPKNPVPKSLHFHPRSRKFPSWSIQVSNCIQIGPFGENLNLAHFDLGKRVLEDDMGLGNGVVVLRLRRLVSEFQSLVEPIDRVKRLLEYSMLLKPVSEWGRSEENRVAGCAAQVWLEVEMDAFGKMRLGADSDSEITKGFCSCLIYLLDGATPEEVLQVKAEDLADMNVGLPVRSRVNSWHNVLVSMQDRTKALVVQREGNHSLESFAASVISPESNLLSQVEEFATDLRSKDYESCCFVTAAEPSLSDVGMAMHKELSTTTKPPLPEVALHVVDIRCLRVL